MRSIPIVAIVFVGFAAMAATPALASPGEVANLQWCAGTKTCLQWDPEPTATQYLVYRGERASLPCLLTPSVESCDDGTFTTTTTSGTITDVPPAGALYWFVVTAKNGSGEGTPGAATSGPRQQNVAGTCLPTCGPSGTSCSLDADCCSSSCIAGTCQAACCQPTAGFCALDSDCCGGACSGGQCQSPCTSASQCPGTDTDCRARTCNAGYCGFVYTPAGTPTTSQFPGDCHQAVCDGSGNITNAVDDSDVSVDGNQCTSDVCVAGIPSNPASPMDTACSQNGGSVCNGFGSCVQCNAASECPGSDTACRARTCTAWTCGFSFAPAGTPTAGQVAGDCRQNQCDGSGNIVNAIDNADVPVDGNQCTSDVCVAGVPLNPASLLGTACNQGGGTICDGLGSCVVPPQVVSTSPLDGGSAPAGSSIAVTLSQAMNPVTLTGQTSAGACSGAIQVSLDGFASCVAFSASAATMSGGNIVATFVPQPGLLVNRTYAIRVTTAAQNASGIPLASTFTQAAGFTTVSPNLCDGSLVISQVYGAGGLTGATYRNDFVELHNRGTSAISLAGMSIQYASATGTTWLSKTNLAGSIPAGGYFLIQGASGGANGASLPTPDATGTIDMSGTVGKIALVASQTSLSGSCPLGGTVIDFVGYGTTANCNEGGLNAPAPSSTTSTGRLQNGCVDLNVNATDFASGAPSPRNSATTANVCACVAQNESNAAAEADYCATIFPLSLAVQTATSTGSIYGQLYEAGVTEPAGAASTVHAQLGYGPATANPQYQPGWTWVGTSYNVQVGNNDEYQASFTAPPVGMYRYVYRFSLDQGVSWTYCDNNQADAGAGSNPGLTFDLENEAVLTVTP